MYFEHNFLVILMYYVSIMYVLIKVLDNLIRMLYNVCAEVSWKTLRRAEKKVQNEFESA
jgi:hypothetical protein